MQILSAIPEQKLKMIDDPRGMEGTPANHYDTITDLPDGVAVGPSGAETCVGVLVIPVDKDLRRLAPTAERSIYSFHFSQAADFETQDSVVHTFEKVLREARGEYEVILCGASKQDDPENDRISVWYFHIARRWLRSQSWRFVKVRRVEANSIYVDPHGNLHVYERDVNSFKE